MLSRSLQIMFNIDDSTSLESIKMDTGKSSKQMDIIITMNAFYLIELYKLFENIFGFITTGME